MLSAPHDSDVSVTPRLGFWDAVSIIIGIVVGTAIFRLPSAVFAHAGGPTQAMLLWVCGGLLAWCGATCYAELATTYPRDGGDYVYLTRAYGPWCGFLFACAQLTTVLSGNIAIMAYAFADYAVRLWPDAKPFDLWVTIAPVVALSCINAIGIGMGKSVQNVLTVAKVIGIAVLILAGLFLTAPPAPAASRPMDSLETNLGLALVFVLYAYGGWSHTAYVAAEVRDQRRNLPRSLFVGLALITLLYLIINATYLKALGFNGVRTTPTPAAEVMHLAFGGLGASAMSILVMLSALSAINGMILTGSRIYAVWGADYPALSWLGTWDERGATPTRAIALQALVAILLIALVGSAAGRNLFDASLNLVGIDGLPWNEYFGGFETLVAGSAPVYWALCLLTGIAVFILRFRDRGIERPFAVPLFMFPAVVFCASCLYMLVASLRYAKWLVMIAVVPLLVALAASTVLGAFRRSKLE